MTARTCSAISLEANDLPDDLERVFETFGGFHTEIVKEAIQWEDGYIIPPTKPGLGIELNEEVAARHPYDGPIFIEVEDRPL